MQRIGVIEVNENDPRVRVSAVAEQGEGFLDWRVTYVGRFAA